MSLVGVQALTAFPAELAKMDARATRLLELQQALDAASRSQPRIESDAVDIAVQNLTLSTPEHTVLAEGLTFEVKRSEAILITGPNGAGKTALARVLLGLWPAGNGVKLSVPPSFSIVPQRPYLAPGCLGDQVTYPKRFGKGDEVNTWKALEKVGLLYLLQRGDRGVKGAEGSEVAGVAEGWLFQCDWEDQLSGGEQQRLALSRVLFHRPCFAVLDECTSMVAADAEERLYQTVVCSEITPVTMSQRLFLPQLHSQELRLGVDSPSKWSLAQLRNGSS